jgi:hypothetical protein
VASRSEFLFQFLRDRHDLAQLTADPDFDPEPPPPFPHADVHLLSSAFQKAIRRGDIAMARRAAHQLYALDRQRLFRRTAVVALEDIGIAAPDVAAELIAIATIPAARRRLGGDLSAIDIAVTRVCQAAKDRSGDFFGSIVGREPVDPWDQAALKSASPKALLAMLGASNLPWKRRLHAALIAAGRHPDSVQTCAVPAKAGSIEAVLDMFCELGAPVTLLTACAAYATRQRDALPVAVPFAWLLHANNCTKPRIVDHDLPAHEMISELPDWAFDPLWTRTGRRAVDLWLRSYWMKPLWLPRQVSAALWNSESGACRQTLSWSMSGELRDRAHAADLNARGVPADRHVELMDWVTHERPALFAARRAAFDSAIRAAGKSAEVNSRSNHPQQVLPFKK